MPHWVKIALGVLGTVTAVVVAIPTGPVGMVTAGVGAATSFLSGLYHPTPGSNTP